MDSKKTKMDARYANVRQEKSQAVSQEISQTRNAQRSDAGWHVEMDSKKTKMDARYANVRQEKSQAVSQEISQTVPFFTLILILVYVVLVTLQTCLRASAET